MNKKLLFDKYNDFNTKNIAGASWINFFRSIFAPSGIMAQAAYIQVILTMGLHISFPFYLIIVFIFLKSWVVLGVNYLIGTISKQTGIWKYSNEYQAKAEHLAPFNVELKETLKTICKRLEIEDKFKDL